MNSDLEETLPQQPDDFAIIHEVECTVNENADILKRIRTKLSGAIDSLDFKMTDVSASTLLAQDAIIGRLESVVKTLDEGKLRIAKMRIAANKNLKSEDDVTDGDIIDHYIKRLDFTINVNTGGGAVPTEEEVACKLAEQLKTRGITLSEDEVAPLDSTIKLDAGEDDE